MSRLVAVDTSVAVPLLLRSHTAHGPVVAWWAGRPVCLTGHGLAETYSVLTRLPGDARLTPSDAEHLIRTRFAPPLMLDASSAAALVDRLAELGIAGGAVYDALVALPAVEKSRRLATRDARARSTYERLGAEVVIVGPHPR